MTLLLTRPSRFSRRLLRGYNGPHHVILNRNEQNLGLAGNVNRVMELASGEIILLGLHMVSLFHVGYGQGYNCKIKRINMFDIR